MTNLYRRLLALYPQDYRNCFEDEMLETFEQASQERRTIDPRAYQRFVCWELAGLAISLPMEWFAKLTTNRSVRGRSLSDLRIMRPVGVPRELWFSAPRLAPDEIAEAEQRVQFCLRRMEHAIATHDFPGARYYSDEDLKARATLRMLKARRGLPE